MLKLLICGYQCYMRKRAPVFSQIIFQDDDRHSANVLVPCDHVAHVRRHFGQSALDSNKQLAQADTAISLLPTRRLS